MARNIPEIMCSEYAEAAKAYLRYSGNDFLDVRGQGVLRCRVRSCDRSTIGQAHEARGSVVQRRTAPPMPAHPGRPLAKSEAELLALDPEVRRWVLARLARSWTQAEAARHLGMTQQLLSQIERGDVRPGGVSRARFRSIYGDEVPA